MRSKLIKRQRRVFRDRKAFRDRVLCQLAGTDRLPRRQRFTLVFRRVTGSDFVGCSTGSSAWPQKGCAFTIQADAAAALDHLCAGGHSVGRQDFLAPHSRHLPVSVPLSHGCLPAVRFQQVVDQLRMSMVKNGIKSVDRRDILLVDLRSYNQGASYNPFTTFIQFNGGGISRLTHHVPYISAPPNVDLGSGSPRWITSTIHHELTHLASLRATRLGWAVHLEAARIIKAARKTRQISLSDKAGALVGALLPILEGLALYAEFDMDEREGDRLLPNPVPLHAQMVSAALGLSEAAIYRAAIEEQCVENPWSGPGLLRLLFADERSPETNHYFVGYLWVKAVALHISTLCPPLRRPTVLLPLLIKLLCDHPAIERVWRDYVPAREAVRSIRGTIFKLDAASLRRVDRALDDPDLAALFELWNLHEFLDDTSATKPKLRLGDEYQALTGVWLEDDNEDVLLARAASSVWLSSSIGGQLVNVMAEDDTKLTLILNVGKYRENSEHTIEILSPTVLWSRMLSAQGVRDDLPTDVAKSFQKAGNLWRGALSRLRRLIERQVTIAEYVLFTSPATFGLYIWDDSIHDALRPVEIPSHPAWYTSGPVPGLIRYQTWLARRLSIVERMKVVKSLLPSDFLEYERREATKAFIVDLCGEPETQRKLLAWRLPGILDARGQRQLELWVGLRRYRQRKWELADHALTQVTRAFDLPPFKAASDRRVFDAEHLLPTFPAEPDPSLKQRRRPAARSRGKSKIKERSWKNR